MEAYVGIRGSESAKISAYVSTSCHYEKKDVDTRIHSTSNHQLSVTFKMSDGNVLAFVTIKKFSAFSEGIISIPSIIGD